VHCQPTSQRPPDLGPEMVDHGFLAMGVEVVHHDVNGARSGVVPYEPPNDPCKFACRAVGPGTGEMAPAFGSTTPKWLAVHSVGTLCPAWRCDRGAPGAGDTKLLPGPGPLCVPDQR